MGLFSEADRSRLLRRAYRLAESANTAFNTVNVGPDLTRRQREKENGIWAEAEKRNEQLTEDDAAKNLRWAVVGGRGEKRLIKTAARQNQRGRGAATRGGQPTGRGGQQGTRGGHQAARGGPGARTAPLRGRGAQALTGANRQPLSQAREDQGRPRIASRRRERSEMEEGMEEEEMEEEGQPPEKRNQQGEPLPSST